MPYSRLQKSKNNYDLSTCTAYFNQIQQEKNAFFLQKLIFHHIWSNNSAPGTACSRPVVQQHTMQTFTACTNIQQLELLLLQFNGPFTRWTSVSQYCLRSSNYTCSGKEPLGLEEQAFSQARPPSCHQTISVKALKGTENTKPHHVAWPHPFFIHNRQTPNRRGAAPFMTALQWLH